MVECTYFLNISTCKPRQLFETIVFAYLQHELHHKSCTLNDATLSFSKKRHVQATAVYRKALGLWQQAKTNVLHACFL